MEITQDKNALIIKLSGDLDHHSAGKIREKIDSEIIVKKPKGVVFDLSELSFMDSSGIGVIMGRYKLMTSHGGRVAVACAGKQVGKLIKLSGLQKIVTEHKNVQDALEEVGV